MQQWIIIVTLLVTQQACGGIYRLINPPSPEQRAAEAELERRARLVILTADRRHVSQCALINTFKATTGNGANLAGMHDKMRRLIASYGGDVGIILRQWRGRGSGVIAEGYACAVRDRPDDRSADHAGDRI